MPTNISSGTKPAGTLPFEAFGGLVTSVQTSQETVFEQDVRDPVTRALVYREMDIDELGDVSLTIAFAGGATLPDYGDAAPTGTGLDAYLPAGGNYKVAQISKTGTQSGAPNLNVTLKHFPAA